MSSQEKVTEITRNSGNGETLSNRSSSQTSLPSQFEDELSPEDLRFIFGLTQLQKHDSSISQTHFDFSAVGNIYRLSEDGFPSESSSYLTSALPDKRHSPFNKGPTSSQIFLPEDFDVDVHTANLLDKERWLRRPPQGSYMGTYLRRGFGLPSHFMPFGHQRTFAEAAFYYYLKSLFADTRDLAFGVIGDGMDLDIVIPSRKVAIEFDDPIREKNATLSEDIEKYLACRAHGFYLIRIKETRTLGDEDSADIIYTVPDILKPKNLQTVIQRVVDALDPACDCWMSASSRCATSRIQVGLRRDKGKIETFTMQLQGQSLSALCPEILNDWNYDKNSASYPEMFTPDSHERVWWHCPICQKDYERPIADRVAGSTCPRCMKQSLGKKHLRATKIVQYSLDGRKLHTWESVNSAARQLGISASNISLCASGKRHHAGGFIWVREKPIE